MELVVYGLVYSMILALTALGFSLTFGISRVANFSIGGLYVLAGYIPWLLISKVGFPYWVAVILAIAVAGGLGWLTYFLILRRVRGFMLAEVISTMALGVIILEVIRGTGMVGFGAKLPSFFPGSVMILGVPLDNQRLAVVIVGLLLFAALWVFTHRTKLGRGFRSMGQNEETALTFGMDSDTLASLSMVAGAVLMAIAGITILPLGIINVDNGYEILVIALTVGIIGGLESTTGILLASLIVGFIQTFAAMYLGSHWVMLVYLISLVLILVFRPSGLLGKSKQLEERV
jgi:branched-chain amino acid transport system permease protein